jgi:hypothetical protein
VELLPIGYLLEGQIKTQRAQVSYLKTLGFKPLDLL